MSISTQNVLAGFISDSVARSQIDFHNENQTVKNFNEDLIFLRTSTKILNKLKFVALIKC